VGTLLALLVFLSIFGIFLTEYVPLWMTDNEESFSNSVASQFGAIKQTMDSLYVSGKTSFAVANPVSMASNGVPVFAQPTQGILGFSEPSYLYTNVSFILGGTSHWFWQNFSTGMIQDRLGDRYYVPLTYALEGDSVIQSQSAYQQTVLFQPSVIANQSGARPSLYLTMFSMTGNNTNGATTSTGLAEVYTTYMSSQTYTGAYNTRVFLNFTTYYPCAWSNSWNKTSVTLNTSGYRFGPNVHPLPGPNAYPVGACSNNLVQYPEKLQISFTPVSTFVLTVVYFQVNIGVGNPT
jgi:hypothetical protein